MPLVNSAKLDDLIAEIVSSDALSAAYSHRVMRSLVGVYEIPQGGGSIVVPQFSGIEAAALTEGTAPSSTNWGTTGLTLTPVERGVYVQISKRALYADPFSDLAPYGDQLGLALASDEDNSILEIAASGQFTNSVGASGLSVTADIFMSGVSYLEGANVPKPYFCVMHPYSWYKLTKTSNFGDASVFDKVGAQIAVGQGEGFPTINGYAGSPLGVPTFISSQVPLTGANQRNNIMFGKTAIAFAYMKEIGVDVFDNVTARAFDLMAWRSAHQGVTNAAWGVNVLDQAA